MESMGKHTIVQITIVQIIWDVRISESNYPGYTVISHNVFIMWQCNLVDLLLFIEILEFSFLISMCNNSQPEHVALTEVCFSQVVKELINMLQTQM